MKYDINNPYALIYSYKCELYTCMLNDVEKNEKGDCQIHTICLWA